MHFVMLNVKIISDEQALRIGAGRLPIWLGRISSTMSFVCSVAMLCIRANPVD